MDRGRAMARNERAIPQSLITHLFSKLPLAAAEAAINRFIDVARPGPVDWYARHVERRLATSFAITNQTPTVIGDGPGCWCTTTMADPACDGGQALFRVSANHRARRAA